MGGSGSQRARSSRNRQKKRTALWVLLSFLAILLLAAVVALSYLLSLSINFDAKSQKLQDAFPPEANRPESGQGLNILLMGSDSRASSDERDVTVSDNSRSDTLIVVHVPQDRSGVYFTSIMRDTWVDIPGRGPAKINAASAFGGSALTIQTVEGLTGARLDHVMRIQFEGFQSLVDALGGVDVDVPLAFKSTNSNRTFVKGPQTMDGATALSFVRERYAFADGDYQRVRNQQNFLKGLFSKLMSRDVLTNPAKISSAIDEFSPFVAVDPNTNAATLGSLGFSLRNLGVKDMSFLTLPNAGTGTSPDGQSIVVPDKQAIAEFGKALREDTMSTFYASIKK